MSCQPGILAPLPAHARYVTLTLRGDAEAALNRLGSLEIGQHVVGIGTPLLDALGATVPGMRGFPSFAGSKVPLPNTPTAAWLWLRGADRGDLVHDSRRWLASFGEDLVVDSVIDGFVHREMRDLSGYIDGTENPTGDDIALHALAQGPDGLRGSSFVATQRWRHDFDALDAMSQASRDDAVGRRQSDNEELEDAPESAHVKRTAQEDFDPEAFMWRRSMPWADGTGAGLQFVAFGRSLDAFDVQLRRMSGDEDGIVDALFGFSAPETGATYWCPPLLDGRLDLRALRG